jgi:hypothetical protein
LFKYQQWLTQLDDSPATQGTTEKGDTDLKALRAELQDTAATSVAKVITAVNDNLDALMQGDKTGL